VEDKEGIKRTNTKTLSVDVDYYQRFLDDTDIPEGKKRELIETLWQIVESFVDLGFGIHPVQQVDTEIGDKLHPAVRRMIAEFANEDLKKQEESSKEGREL